ncbi:unnamed protein product, partial [Ectocarpus sp. 8 AP-2014]
DRRIAAVPLFVHLADRAYRRRENLRDRHKTVATAAGNRSSYTPAALSTGGGVHGSRLLFSACGSAPRTSSSFRRCVARPHTHRARRWYSFLAFFAGDRVAGGLFGGVV